MEERWVQLAQSYDLVESVATSATTFVDSWDSRLSAEPYRCVSHLNDDFVTGSGIGLTHVTG
jgi:hypothetical protein